MKQSIAARCQNDGCMVVVCKAFGILSGQMKRGFRFQFPTIPDLPVGVDGNMVQAPKRDAQRTGYPAQLAKDPPASIVTINFSGHDFDFKASMCAAYSKVDKAFSVASFKRHARP